MSIFDKILILSKQIASALLAQKTSKDLEQSDVFSEEDKKYILNHLTDASLVQERKKIRNQIDKRADLEKVKNKITISTQKSYWKYAVAASVIGIVMGSYMFKDAFFSFTAETTVKHNITTGTDKAILTLDDGSSVILQKGKAYQKNNISSNGEALVYNASKKTKATLKYNYLTIPRGGQFSIKLSDGTKVWLNSESQLKYPEVFAEGSIRKVELVYGEAYFEVSPSSQHKGSKFKVVNKQEEVEVIGTAFNIKAYKNEADTYTTLVEGKIALTYKGKRQNLVPNQQSHLDFKTNILTLKKVDVYDAIAWKKGVFSFENKSLKEIMKVLARWYDMEVIFENEKNENIQFNGVLDKNQKIEEVLSIIQSFKVITSYTINNKTVIIN